jgi:aspartate kinase
LRVTKFGGTSVATAERLRQVQAIIDADPGRRIIVPSAPGKAYADDTKITDLLYLMAELAAAKQDIGQVWGRIADRFAGIIAGLGLRLDLTPVLDETRAAIVAGASTDYVASRGEAIHGHIVAALLGAEYIDAAEVIRFSRRGRLDEASYGLIRRRCRGPGRYVIPGFYGALADGTVLTFSRGGSDVTGAIVANALDAAVYENWTDVSGVLMADPRIVPGARVIQEITYHELRELSYMGAQVLHDEAVFPVRGKGIPINLRNTYRPEDPGTMIVADRDPGDEAVAGIAGRPGFTVIYLAKTLMNHEVGFSRRVLDVFEHLGIAYEHMPSGIDTLSVVIDDRQLGDKLDQVLEEIAAAVAPDELKAIRGMALVATVGKGMNHHLGVAARLFTALAEAGINIRMIDQGSSEQNIIVGVEEADLKPAIKAIYHAFVDR